MLHIYVLMVSQFGGSGISLWMIQPLVLTTRGWIIQSSGQIMIYRTSHQTNNGQRSKQCETLVSIRSPNAMLSSWSQQLTGCRVNSGFLRFFSSSSSITELNSFWVFDKLRLGKNRRPLPTKFKKLKLCTLLADDLPGLQLCPGHAVFLPVGLPILSGSLWMV